MAEITALEKHACPACGAQAEWNPAKQKLVCPFCGTESPYVIDRATGKAVENDLVKALRELPDGRRGWDTERRSVQCQSCQRGHGLRPGAGRPELRVLRLAGARRLQGDQGADPAREPAAVQDRRRRVRDDMRRWWRSQWLAPGRLARVARRHCTASTFRTGRSTRTSAARGKPRPGTTTTSACRIATQGPHGDAAGAARALGAGLRRDRHTRSTMSRCRARTGIDLESAPAGRAVSDAGPRAVRHRVPLRLRRRALPGRAVRRGERVAAADARRSSRSCARRRFPATPTATCGSIRSTRARRSSTSSCRSGC